LKDGRKLNEKRKMKRATRIKLLTQEYDFNGEFHVAIEK